ncbi:MAG TPA: hypothetical protein VFG84_11480 [Gemmatimonadaceae bacterium]|nr:hypothetical protein [Gemmatimonadaceae bacterium]
MRPMKKHLSRATILAALIVPALFACTADRTADIQQAEAILDLGDAVNDLRMQASDLQFRVDSLKEVVARQDTVLRQLANLAGVPIPR